MSFPSHAVIVTAAGSSERFKQSGTKLQKKEFIKEENLRKKLNKTPHPADKDFLEALKKGLPDCSGVALGIDRLTMIFTDQTDINNVILFAGEEIFDF